MSLTLPQQDCVRLYDRLAPDYDRLHRRWLRHAGGEAQVALEAAVRALATPDTNLLDAGCGTGTFARTLVAEGVSPACVTLLDPSDEMLTRCSDLPARRVKGWLEALPFEDGEFDMVTCAWALETTPAPKLALRELCRVVRPGGVLCLAFCAQAPAHAPAAWLMRQAIMWRGTGQFLSREHVANEIRGLGGFEVRLIPSNGPAAALLAHKDCALPHQQLVVHECEQATDKPLTSPVLEQSVVAWQ
ncbi:MAG: class I SAM-dependent methyltransferase [Paracoccaceae bacterium]